MATEEEMLVKTPEEKRSLEFKKLINQIVMNDLGKDIMALDDIVEEEGQDKAWEHVGLLIHRAVEAGLMFQAKKIQKLQKKIELLGG